MALDRDQVGLIFKLSADSKPAEAELEQFKGKIGKSSKEAANIARESFETLSSEIIESFGIDGDIANSLAATALNLKATTLLAVGAIAAIPIAAVAATVGLFAAAKSTAELAEQIDNLNQKTGISTEALSALRIAAEDSGSSFESAGSALGQLAQKFSDAQRGSKDARAIFNALGVDLNGPIDDALRKIIKRFDELPDGPKKLALATELGVADILPALNSLEGELDANIEKARELGLVFDKEAIAAAKRLGDQTDALSRQFEGLKVTIGNAVIPAFTGYIGILNQVFSITRKLIQGNTDLISTLAKLVTLGLIAQNPSFLSAFAQVLSEGEEKTPSPKTGDIKLPSKAGRAKQKTKIEPFDTVKLSEDLLKFQRKREAQLESEAFDASEKAAQRHQERLEAIERLGSERLITAARDGAQNRLITQEMAEQLIADIRLTAFAAQEDLLKKELDAAKTRLDAINEAIEDQGVTPAREKLQAEEIAAFQEANDKLRILQEQRSNLESEAVRDIEAARKQDLENLQRYIEEQTRLREDLKNIERADPLSARSLIGDRFADVLAETGNVTTAIQASITSVLGSLDSLKTSLEDIASGALTNFVQGLGSIVQNYVLMGETGPAALRKLLAATLAAIAAESAVNAIVELAKGFAALFLNPPEAAAHFKAAALFGAAAAAAGVAGRAVAPGGAGAGGGTGGGGTQGREGPRPIIQGDRAPGQVTIVLRMEEGIVAQKLIGNYRDNGELRRVIRSDLVGETPT